MADHEEGIESISFLDGLISQETRRRTREQTQPFIDACCSPGCIRSTVLTVGISSLLLTALLITIFLTRSNSTDEVTINSKDPPYYMLKQVTEDQLREHIKFLSNDLLEGRAPGTRGEALATAYIASHFRTMGLNPINNTYIHDVPMRGLTAQKGELFITRDNYAPLNLTFASDFTADSDLDNSSISIQDADMVFGGNCVFSPHFHTEPFEEVDVGGSIIVCLMGPVTFIDNPDFSNVSEFYTTTNYKLSYIRSLKVKGVLMIHTEQSTGYSWDVYQNRFGAGEQLALQDSSGDSNLLYKGWIREEIAENFFELNGRQFYSEIQNANNSEFRAYPLQTKFSVSVDYAVRNFDARLVMGYIGPPPTTPHNSVLIMAHHDHLGIRAVASPPLSSSSSLSPSAWNSSSNTTDDIYNGAVDNASGLAGLLSAAYAISTFYKEPFIIHPDYDPPPLLKTIVFLTTTGRESMLGTTYFTETNFCEVPLCGASVAFNFDLMNMWGRTINIEVVGKQMSTLVNEVADASIGSLTSVNGLRQSLGDAWPLVLSNCSSVSFAITSNLDPNPLLNYMATKQYRPTDEYDESMNMEGLIQQVQITLRMAYRIAVNESIPELTQTFENLLLEIKNWVTR